MIEQRGIRTKIGLSVGFPSWLRWAQYIIVLYGAGGPVVPPLGRRPIGDPPPKAFGQREQSEMDDWADRTSTELELVDGKLRIKARHLSSPAGELNHYAVLPLLSCPLWSLPLEGSSLNQEVLLFSGVPQGFHRAQWVIWDALWPRATLSQMAMISRFSWNSDLWIHLHPFLPPSNFYVGS